MTFTDAERTTLIENYRDKSRAAIENVKHLLEHHMLSLAAHQIYYGIFYMLSAVALKDNFSTSKHQQLLGWFNKTYVHAGRFEVNYSQFIREAYENRIKGDYDVRFDFSEEQLEQAFTDMQAVIAAIERLLGHKEE